MKKYHVRKGSFLDELIGAIPATLILIALILIAGLGNHFIDGMGV